MDMFHFSTPIASLFSEQSQPLSRSTIDAACGNKWPTMATASQENIVVPTAVTLEKRACVGDHTDSATGLFIVPYPFIGNYRILLGLRSGTYVEGRCFSHSSDALQESQRRCAVDRAILRPHENVNLAPRGAPICVDRKPFGCRHSFQGADLSSLLNAPVARGKVGHQAQRTQTIRLLSLSCPCSSFAGKCLPENICLLDSPRLCLFCSVYSPQRGPANPHSPCLADTELLTTHPRREVEE